MNNTILSLLQEHIPVLGALVNKYHHQTWRSVTYKCFIESTGDIINITSTKRRTIIYKSSTPFFMRMRTSFEHIDELQSLMSHGNIDDIIKMFIGTMSYKDYRLKHSVREMRPIADVCSAQW